MASRIALSRLETHAGGVALGELERTWERRAISSLVAGLALVGAPTTRDRTTGSGLRPRRAPRGVSAHVDGTLEPSVSGGMALVPKSVARGAQLFGPTTLDLFGRLHGTAFMMLSNTVPKTSGLILYQEFEHEK